MSGPFDRVIRNGIVVTSDGQETADVAISDGRIAAVGSGLRPGREEIDATGHYVMPGGVDPHCHIEQMSGMGVMSADTFETATRSAAMGGTTSVISFAAQAPGQRLSDAMADYAARAERGAMIDHAFHIIVADTDVPGFPEDIGTLAGRGHRSIKVFTTYAIRLDDRQILDVMWAAKQAGSLVCIHAENDALIGWTKERLLAAGHTRPIHHALSHPRLAEVEAVERMCRFAEFLAQPVMLFHISTAEGVDAVRIARERGAPVWAETCPHYLFMTADVLDRPGIEGAKWMCSPPQRTAADQDALWRGIEDGTISVISSDHAPYRFDETGKRRAGPAPPFDKIANGMPGLETRLPLLFDAMVNRGGPGAEAFVRLTATEPARLYGLPGKGEIAPGFDADIAIWDPKAERRFDANDLHDNVGYNPYVGTTVTGWPVMVLLRGRKLVEDGTFKGAPGLGRHIRREAIGTMTPAQPAPEVRFLGDGE